MEYLDLLKEPTVILTILIALFSSYISKLGKYLINHMFLVPDKLISIIRANNWRYKKKILLKSQNQSEVTWQIVRAYAFLIMFCGLLITYCLLSLFSSSTQAETYPISVQLFIASPIYVFEALWIIQRQYARELVNASGRYV